VLYPEGKAREEKEAGELTSFLGETGLGLAIVKRRHWGLGALETAEGHRFAVEPLDSGG